MHPTTLATPRGQRTKREEQNKQSGSTPQDPAFMHITYMSHRPFSNEKAACVASLLNKRYRGLSRQERCKSVVYPFLQARMTRDN
jgi:hypothetical protein